MSAQRCATLVRTIAVTAHETGVDMTVEDVIAEYSAAWSQTDPAARMQMLRRTVVADVPYCDPGAQVIGLDALSSVIAGVQEQFPGGMLKRTWNGDVLQLSGPGAEGAIVLEAGELVGSATLKPPASLMRPVIEQKIGAALNKAAQAG